METCNTRGVASASPVSWARIAHLMEGRVSSGGSRRRAGRWASARRYIICAQRRRGAAVVSSNKATKLP
ncbi:hypothetical protein EVAR_87252_1 [Eumeta japonica]|uniref:Uncharacterized protein n=1 Tax=Eumeta variegata TaxID=151549 RepID=A0A4C1YRA0_EUMVA|nr:hypothetical protein EVAR_87252_1 [Eumeta japonica]